MRIGLPLKSEVIETIVNNYGNDKTVTQIAKEQGINKTTVTKYLRKYNIPILQRGPYYDKRIPQDVTNDVISDYNNGLYIKNISSKYNLSVITVRKILIRNGVHKNIEKYKNRYQSKSKVLNFVDKWESQIINGTATIYDLAAIYKVNPKVVAYHLHKRGVDTKVPENIKSRTKAGAIRNLARENAEAVMERLIDIALNSEEEKLVILAAREIFDRGYGKAKEADTDEDSGESNIAQILKLVPGSVKDRILNSDSK